MPRTSSRLSLVFLGLSTAAGFVSAQQAQPSQQPPRLERIEPGSDVPATTIPDRAGTRIIEKKEGGQVTEVVVQTPVGSTYVMKPHNPPGNAQVGDAQSAAIRAPQWKVLEFDIGVNKNAASGEQAATTAPTADAPPPPPPPAATPAKQ